MEFINTVTVTLYNIIIAHSGCIDSTSSTTDMIIESIPASSGLSGELSVCHASCIVTGLILCFIHACTAGEITAVIVGVVCSLAGVCIICLLILLKMYHNGMNRHSSKFNALIYA